MDYLRDILIALGGGSVALVGLLTIFKSLFMKFFEKGIDVTFDKKLENYKNKLSRSTAAYEMLLDREMGYYTKVESFHAELVVLIQDLVFYCTPQEGVVTDSMCAEYQKLVERLMKIIIELKNIDLMHQAYIPMQIFQAGTVLTKAMQDSFEHWVKINSYLCNEQYEEINQNKSNEYQNEILMSVALVVTLIQKRLKEMSEAEDC